MQTKFLFILLQLHCLLFFTNGHSSYKYRNRNRSRGASLHNAQALVQAEQPPPSPGSASQPHQARHHPQIECDFLSHKESGCEDEIGSRCDPNTHKCTCKDSHPVRLLDFCLKISRLAGPCYTSAQCAGIANASCYIFDKEYDVETSSGFHNVGPHLKYWPIGVCKCRLGFAYNLTTNSCQKQLIGSWCSQDKHCWTLRSLNLICDKKRGECAELPDTTPANSAAGGVGNHHRPVYYMARCEHDTDCSLASSTVSSPASSSSSSPSSSTSSTHSPPAIHPTPGSTPDSSSAPAVSSPKSLPLVSSTVSSSLASASLMLEQADQENGGHPYNRYLHGHRRLKDSLKRLSNYHLREMQCIRGRCMCANLYTWDGGVHCRDYEPTVGPNGTHRPHRKNHNTFSDLDDELNDLDDEDGSMVSWQTIFLMALGSSLLAGFIFRFCYYRKCYDDDDMSEDLRSPDGLYAHKVAFLSKPVPSAMNGCGSHFDPAYGYIPSAPSCYHDFDYGHAAYAAMCNGGAPPAHPLAPSAPIRNHLQQATASGSLGKPPNEADEDEYLLRNPEERDSFKKEEAEHLECGQIRTGAVPPLGLPCAPPPPELQASCCGCECNSLVAGKETVSLRETTRAILEQYAADGCATPATTTTTTGGRTSSSGTDEEKEALSGESKSDFIESDLKDEDKEQLELTSLSNSLHTACRTIGSDLGSDDSNEETDEHIAILSRKPRKEPKAAQQSSSSKEPKWHSSAGLAETTTLGAASSVTTSSAGS